ncbi:MAG: hypothetical protein US33_C0021G0017 [Parcubacteria group bacterium GW2011_GWC1_36_9]|uniref:Uncharacterized protein n=2 Tax=Parcubacteria group TaxID=1794811 RepID=A0A0G0KAR9_9BACT|nr:MAG: hypothetical protein US33_C0021G0017 [Parcubacteria group bacterium GW2011_GWC1_36_9]KKQ27007.1 MAG: hypothetical protein US41_C0026G0012 [Parcubacteria group bacterium GW2011_GWB1_37_13]KKQ46214.1 MAG: hypothetical protein US65_C0043G0002 [Candidatus Yanofskybacteria bacterium GW2011_GWC2_37_9]
MDNFITKYLKLKYNVFMNEKINTLDNLEIDKALKEFEMKSNTEPEPQAPAAIPSPEASSIKFETDSYKAVKFYNETDTPKMVRLVMKYSGGLIKEQKQAEYVLFGLAIVIFGISLYLFFGGGSKSPTFNENIPAEVLPL